MATAAAPTVASSTTLWATASKEWVIPSKPKPGRKPKKDTSQVVDDDDVDSKGRRVQNRAAQRAFRERKQSQLAELQARVQSYEQGEIERNVALQNIAKRLKEENEALRRENSMLKENVTKLESERDGLQATLNERKHPRDLSPGSSRSSTVQHIRKKSKRIPEPSATSPASMSHDLSSPSMVSSPESSGSNDSPYSPVQLDLCSNPAVATPMDYSKSSCDTSAMTAFDCGYCTPEMHCVCREVALQEAVSGSDMGLKLETYEPENIIVTLEPRAKPPSILDNLPAYQPPIPLRRKAPAQNANPVFKVTPPQTEAPDDRPANCSGDPNNCVACANDSFGKAFCEAIGKSVACMGSCADCPGNCHTHPTVGRSIINQPAPLSTASSSIDAETMTTSEAWRQLKSHPNVSFSDLSLLADVVARRSKCTGPRVVISPAPGSITPERSHSPVTIEPQPTVMSDSHAQFHGRGLTRSPPPQLVPEDVLVKCGQQRRGIREVQAAGVRDALRLLDAKFS